MNQELVKVVTKEELSKGGVGLDFSSKLFRLKPTTLTINQGTTQAEGAIPGKFRIVETGEQFSEMSVALLMEPDESRSYYEGTGEPGELVRKPENLMCFSRDMIRPDARSKVMQAPTCASCELGQWDKTVTPNKPPKCDPFYYVVLIDTVTQIPMRHYVRATNKKAFVAAMQNLARTIKLMQAKGLNPNIWDIAFNISTEKYKNKAGQVSHILKVDNKSFHKVTPEEAEKFGELYLDYVNYGKQDDDTVEAETNKTVDATIEDGTITI